MKLNVAELNVVQDALELVVSMPLNSNDFERKMIVFALQKVHQKVLAKWNYPSAITKISLTNTEAVAFYLMFKDEDFSNEYRDFVLKFICNKIHKQYI